MMIAGTERRRQGCSLQDGKQWGKILGDTVNLKIINFPVSFNECFGGLALFNGDPVAAAEYATITDITNTNFKIYMYANNAGTGYANANIFYLFLGAQQQWGASGYAVTFPIAFNVVYNVLSIPQTTASTSNAYWGRFYITALTKNGFNVSDTGAGSNRWIAIGSAQQQWGNGSSSSFSKKDYATPKDIGTVTISTPISMSTLYQGFICASSTSGPSLFVGFVTAYSGNSLTVRLITSLDSGSGGSLVPNYILLGH